MHLDPSHYTFIAFKVYYMRDIIFLGHASYLLTSKCKLHTVVYGPWLIFFSESHDTRHASMNTCYESLQASQLVHQKLNLRDDLKVIAHTQKNQTDEEYV